MEEAGDNEEEGGVARTTSERIWVGHVVEREKSKEGGRGGRRRAEVGEEGGEGERRGTTANEKRRRADEREGCLPT